MRITIFSATLCLISLLTASAALPLFAAAKEDAPVNPSRPVYGTLMVIMYEEQQMAKAKDVVQKYIHDKYAWDESIYQIRMDSKNASSDVMRVLISHRDDEHPAAPGGGKSFLLDVDMRNMRIVRELRMK